MSKPDSVWVVAVSKIGAKTSRYSSSTYKKLYVYTAKSSAQALATKINTYNDNITAEMFEYVSKESKDD